MPAPSVRATTSATAVGPTLTGTMPTNVDGDLCLAFVSVAGAPANSSTPPGGWATLYDVLSSSGVVREACYYRTAASEPGTYNWTIGAAQNCSVMLMTVSGVHATRPILGFLNNDANSATHTLRELVVNSTLDCLMVAAFSLGRGATTTTQPSGYTLDQNPDAGGGTGTGSTESGLAHKTVTAGSPSATSWSTSNGAFAITGHLALLGTADTQPLFMRDYKTSAVAASSLTPAVPFHYSTDRLVIGVAYRLVGGLTVTTPSGFTRIGTVVTAGGGDYGIDLFERVSDGSESGTFTITLSAGATFALAFAFALCSSSEVGTRSTTTDTSNDATYDVPGMTLSSQSPAALMLLFSTLAPGNRFHSTPPTGWLQIEDLYPNSSALLDFALLTKAEAGPNPSATTGAIGNGVTAGPNIARVMAYALPAAQPPVNALLLGGL